MSDVVLFGFERSTYVNVARLVLLAKGVAFEFSDTESAMRTEGRWTLHPFGRVPVLRHKDALLWETAAIVTYVDEAFDGPPLQPASPRGRAAMRAWMGSVDAYFYPWIVFNLVHERLVFGELGIEADERVVARALPEIRRILDVLERHLAADRTWLADERPTLADCFMLPCLTALGFTEEGRGMLARTPAIGRWLAGMATLPAVQQLRAMLPPPAPIEHARHWVETHRAAACSLSSAGCE
jgi:glutathione S-transferase